MLRVGRSRAVSAPLVAGALVIAAAGLIVVRQAPAAHAAQNATVAPLLEPLQPLIDAAEVGAVVTPAPGRYTGPVVISKPVTLDGRGKVVVDGGGKGTVIRVIASGVTVQNLEVLNSGDQHNDIDAGSRLEGDSNVVKDNVIDGCLFGVDLQKASRNVVRRNRITSKADVALGVKGDAIRIWYGDANRIEDNVITGARDLVVWYSKDNVITGNDVRHGRYGLHFMYDKGSFVEGNTFAHNLVGISMMYSVGIVLRGNRIFHALGPAGTGIGFKESSDAEIFGNEVLYNAIGLAFDITPFEPETTTRVYGNRIAFNDIGVSFLSDRPGNIFKDNLFLSNAQQVAMSRFERAAQAVWQRNFWDDYEGFDHDRDGIGDKPFIMRSYADRLWMDVPAAGFFKGSPALAALDFIERLAPFSEPLKLLEDGKPRVSRDFTPMRPDDDPDLAKANHGPAAEDEGKSDTPMVYETDVSGRLDPFGLHRSPGARQ